MYADHSILEEHEVAPRHKQKMALQSSKVLGHHETCEFGVLAPFGLVHRCSLVGEHLSYPTNRAQDRNANRRQEVAWQVLFLSKPTLDLWL